MTHSYFKDLNYSLSNEDSQIEAELLKPNLNKVLAVAGSGARVIPLLTKNPKSLVALDLSLDQLYLTELRVSAIRQLSYEEFLYFMGYRGGIQGEFSKGRSNLFSQLELSAPCRQYWQKHEDYWMAKGFISLGRWESHFQKIGFFFRKILQCDFLPIFSAQTMEEQIEAYHKYWPHRRFSAAIKVAASEIVFDSFLYKGHFSGKKDRLTESVPPSEFISQQFARLFQTTLVRKNYFLQTLFLGSIRFEEGLPMEAWLSTWQQVHKNTTDLEYRSQGLVEALSQEPFDFYSLSDVISYLPEDQASQILQMISPETKQHSKVILRSFLRAPKNLDSRGWLEMMDDQNRMQIKDGTGIYKFHIFKKQPEVV